MKDHSEFLAVVKSYCIENPEAVPLIFKTTQEAIIEKLGMETDKRAKTEAALGMALSRRMKRNDLLLAQMLEDMKPFACFRYDDVIASLRKEN